MAYQLHYTGSFPSTDGVMWTVQILTASGPGAEGVGLLQFPSDEPLIIEWNEAAKHEPIFSSMATLTLLSPSDRTYVDVLSSGVGRRDPEVMLRVLRQDQLYWMGKLDSDLYEEPYARLQDYEVTVAFTDLGVLSRLAWSHASPGILSLAQVISHCLTAAGLDALPLQADMVSTCLGTATGANLLSSLYVHPQNFYDEEGEPLTLRDVLEGILRPLGIRIQQRAGQIFLLDLNGLYHGPATPSLIEWMAEDQVLSVSPSYNQARITWSPFVQSGMLTSKDCWTIQIDPNLTNPNRATGAVLTARDNLLQRDVQVSYWSYPKDQDPDTWTDTSNVGFTLWTSRTGRGAELLHGWMHFFKIVPQQNGDEREGIALFWKGVQIRERGRYFENCPQNNAHVEGNAALTEVCKMANGQDVGNPLFRTDRFFIPPVDNANELLISVRLEALFDPRVNPYEEARNMSGAFNYIDKKRHYDQWQSDINFIYVPVRIFFEGTFGSRYVWTCDLTYSEVPDFIEHRSYGYWALWEDNPNNLEFFPHRHGYLCYYDPYDRRMGSAGLGWKVNHQLIPPYAGELGGAITQLPDGQLIPYPNMSNRGGWVWMEVMQQGWIVSRDLSRSDGRNHFPPTTTDRYPHDVWTQQRNWTLLQLPEFQVLRRGMWNRDLLTDDVLSEGVLDQTASEPLELDTICGTPADARPMARGAYLQMLNNCPCQVRALQRAGRQATAEDLLLGTLLSQYADRLTMLSGTVRLDTQGVRLFTEASQPTARRFMVLREVQNLAADTAEATFCELRPDEYHST